MTKRAFTFDPVGFDLFAPHAGTPVRGADGIGVSFD